MFCHYSIRGRAMDSVSAKPLKTQVISETTLFLRVTSIRLLRTFVELKVEILQSTAEGPHCCVISVSGMNLQAKGRPCPRGVHY